MEVRGPSAFLAFLAAALVTAGHQAKVLSLGALPEWIAACISAACIMFGVLSLPWLLQIATYPARRLRSKRKFLGELDIAIHTLTSEEARVFWPMVLDGKRATYAQIGMWGSVGHKGLYGRGLFVAQANVGEGHVFIIPDHVWKAVAHRQDLAREVLATLPRQSHDDRL